MDIIEGVIHALAELADDTSVPKNVREKVNAARGFLGEKDTELSIKVNKALAELEEVSEDINIQTYTRTQLWNIASMLEKALLK